MCTANMFDKEDHNCLPIQRVPRFIFKSTALMIRSFYMRYFKSTWVSILRQICVHRRKWHHFIIKIKLKLDNITEILTMALAKIEALKTSYFFSCNDSAFTTQKYTFFYLYIVFSITG